jgi:hypothetical protein
MLRRMRRSALALAVAGALLAGCGGPSDEDQVRQTVSAFGQATRARDYRRMCDDLLAPQLVDRVEQIGLPCEQALRQGLGNVRDPRLIVGQVTVNGSTATADVRSSATGQAPSRDTLRLQKLKGRWRIASLGSG